MRRLLLLAGVTLLVAAAAAPAASAAPRTVWLCKPGLRHNPCTPGLGTTVFSPSGKKLRVEHPRRARRPKADCFYVYPTVSDQKTPNANLNIDPEERSIALYQAARYSQYCRVFAPIYRQLTLSGILGGPRGDPAIAYSDVLQAWRTYLRRYNHGRPFVLIGHSQGSFVLRTLVTQQIDPKRAVRRRLLSAILLGGNVTVKSGRDVGGDFKHIRACHSRTQLRCVVAFSTYNQQPPAGSLFGGTSVSGRQVLCTNPTALGGGSGLTDTVFPSEPFAPGTTIAGAIALLHVTWPPASTPWISVSHGYRARCSSAGGFHVLRIASRRGAPVITPSPTPQWGLHLVDANIALGNLVRLVHSEAAAYARRH
jgi:hypothetical protein